MAKPVFDAKVRVAFNNLPKIGLKWRNEAAALAEEYARRIASTARDLAPVGDREYDDGGPHMFETIEARPVPGRRLQWEVVVGADYGHYVEYGTVHMEAQPFLLPAFERHGREYELALADMLDAIPRRLG